jgi:hypothetical protein
MNLASDLNSIREKTFYYSLLSVVAFFPFSEALVSITSSILLLQSFILTSWKHPSFKKKQIGGLILLSSVFAVYLIGMFFTRDGSFALYELKKVVFWVVIPLAFYLSPVISKDRFLRIVLLFCLAVLLSSIYGVFRLWFKDSFHISDFRDIISVSHIRFSFQIILSVIFVTYFMFSGEKLPVIGHNRLILYLFLTWIICFLFLLRSITGIAAFIGSAFVSFLYFVFRIKNRFPKVLLVIAAILTVAIPVTYVAVVWTRFFDIEKLDPEKVDWITPSGNPYSFDFSSAEKENGNWVRTYICEEELRKEWNSISSCKYDSIDPYGFPYSATLIRYLTSKGYRKDSAGVHMLSPDDIRAVENSVANHIYADKSFSVYPRVYETIWELDTYSRTGDPNYQSVSQRIEYIKASFFLIRQKPLFGIGTGNWKISYGEAYKKINSKLIPENQGPSHNQYLNYLVKFGITGFIFIFSALFIPFFREGHSKNPVFWLFLISILIANLGDANLETHMGLSFFCFFYCLFLWNTPPGLRNFLS